MRRFLPFIFLLTACGQSFSGEQNARENDPAEVNHEPGKEGTRSVEGARRKSMKEMQQQMNWERQRDPRTGTHDSFSDSVQEELIRQLRGESLDANAPLSKEKEAAIQKDVQATIDAILRGDEKIQKLDEVVDYPHLAFRVLDILTESSLNKGALLYKLRHEINYLTEQETSIIENMLNVLHQFGLIQEPQLVHAPYQITSLGKKLLWLRNQLYFKTSL